MQMSLRGWLPGVLLGLVILTGIVGWQIYDLGKLHGVVELAQVRSLNYQLKREIGKLSVENKSMLERIAILERSAQIDQQAAQAVKSDMSQLEDQLQAAREEVEFYRGIVAPGDVNPGLRIHRFTLEAGVAAGEFHYDLVLTQLKHNDQFISGVVDWKISGTRADAPAELGLSAVTDPEIRQLKFRFRYFQDLTGILRLPEGFIPDHVTLTVQPEGKGNQGPVTEKFSWP